MLKQALNYEIDRLGEIENSLTEITNRIKTLQAIEMINFKSETRELEHIKEAISDIRLTLFEIILDIPKTRNTSDNEDSSDHEP